MPKCKGPNTTEARWGLKPGTRVWVGGHNTNARREVEEYLEDMIRPPSGAIDLAFITPQSVGEGVYFARKLCSRIECNGVVWVVIPDEASPRRTEFSGTIREIVSGMALAGYSEKGAAALGGNYTSLSFKPMALISFASMP